MPEARPPLVPELRFPDFRDAGPWEVKRLGELVETVTPPKKLQTSEYLPSGRFPIIDQSPSDVCGWTDDETALVQADFPLVVFGDHSCVVKLADGPFAQGADGIRILAPTSDIEARFLFLSLQADPIEQKGYRRHFSTLKEKQIPFPGKDTGEQQKIADCLSSLDDLIRAEEGRLEALRAHKTGLMQRLFPRPGETTPRLRFPEFRDAGPWEVKRLGEMGKFYRGLSYSPKDVSGRGLLVLRAGNIQDGRISLEADLVFVSKSCPEDILLQRGDIVICMSNGSKPLVGKSGELDSDLENEVTVGAFCSIFRPTNDFARFAFRTPRYGRFIEENIAGGSINNLKSSDLEKFEFYIPSVPDEQEKIADCLTALDELILAQGETIEALKTHKRGLMQKLFPREVG